MNTNWFTSTFSGATSKGDVISASTLNVTKIVSFFAAIFAGITQVLASTDVVALSTTQMVTIWLVVAGLVVLLAITDMICRAYITGKGIRSASTEGLNLPVDVRLHGGGERQATLEDTSTAKGAPVGKVQWTDDRTEEFVALADIILRN